MPIDPPIEESHDAIRSALAPVRNDVSVAVFAAGNAFAVGAIIRVAHSFLVREILLIGSEPHYAKASMGMHKLETIVRLPHEEAFFDHVRGRPVIALEREASTASIHAVRQFPDGCV